MKKVIFAVLTHLIAPIGVAFVTSYFTTTNLIQNFNLKVTQDNSKNNSQNLNQQNTTNNGQKTGIEINNKSGTGLICDGSKGLGCVINM